MAMRLEHDEALRRKGWKVFRSATRDRVVPGNSAGAVLQRIRLNEAAPVSGVFEGVAISMEDREANRKQEALARALAERSAVGTPLGITQTIEGRLFADSVVPTVVPGTDVTAPIARAPFDGFLTSFMVRSLGGAGIHHIAVRTSGGQTMFKSASGVWNAVGIQEPEPDQANFFVFESGFETYREWNGKMPVFAGEDITAKMWSAGVVLVGDVVAVVSLTFEAFIMARPGSAAAESMFGALTVESRRAAREAANNDVRLQLERERTARERLEQEGLTKRAELGLEAIKAKSRTMVNPFHMGTQSPSWKPKLAAREPVPPPNEAGYRAGGSPGDGKGKTFVQSWMPDVNGVGYLIPDPPRGGKVNVFDGKYTVWDMFGKQVSQGQVEVVRSSDQIPDGARLSPNLRTTPSMAMRVDQQAILNTRFGGSAFGEGG